MHAYICEFQVGMLSLGVRVLGFLAPSGYREEVLLCQSAVLLIGTLEIRAICSPECPLLQHKNPGIALHMGEAKQNPDYCNQGPMQQGSAAVSEASFTKSTPLCCSSFHTPVHFRWSYTKREAEHNREHQPLLGITWRQ